MELNNQKRFVFKSTESKRVKFDTFTRYIFASTYVKDKTVLDAACGSGFGTFFYAQEAKEVVGVDNSIEAIDYAKNNYQRENIRFINDDLIKTDKLAKNYFDVIISFHTMEQTTDPATFLNKLFDMLKDDGTIILSTQNKRIVSPFIKGTSLDCNNFDFTKQDLEKLFSNKFNIEWFGQRCTFKPLTWFPVRGVIRLLEKILNKKFGFYGARESYQIAPLKFWQEPKDFIVVLTKR